MSDKATVLSQAIPLVREFMEARGVPADVFTQIKLISEESIEVVEAWQNMFEPGEPTEDGMADFLKEVADHVYVCAGYIILTEDFEEGMRPFGLDEALHEMGFYFRPASQLILNAFDLFLDDGFVMRAVNAVHTSNMSKFDGATYREDGKLLKGPNYKEPNLQQVAREALGRLRHTVDLAEVWDEAA